MSIIDKQAKLNELARKIVEKTEEYQRLLKESVTTSGEIERLMYDYKLLKLEAAQEQAEKVSAGDSTSDE